MLWLIIIIRTIRTIITIITIITIKVSIIYITIHIITYTYTHNYTYNTHTCSLPITPAITVSTSYAHHSPHNIAIPGAPSCINCLTLSYLIASRNTVCYNYK